MRTRLMLAAVLGVLLVLAGCGGEVSTLPVQDDSPVGGDTAGTSATLPNDWPSDVPVPDTLTLVNAVRVAAPEGPTWSGTWQGSRDPGQVYDQLARELQSNGFTQEGGLGGNGDGGISAWAKNGLRVQLTVLVEAGQTGANITVVDQGT